MTELVSPSYQKGLQELRDNLVDMLPADALQVFDTDAHALQKRHTAILKLQVGDHAPDFSLSNALNETINLYKVLETQRVVLTFYRGTWCPYCNLMLSHYQAIVPELRAAGATLIAISPQTPDASLSIKEKNELQFEVLSDNGNMVARKFTTVFKNGEAPIAQMTALGIDFDSFYADDSQELPVPATFVIEKDGSISFAQTAGGDYRNRIEANDILSHLNADNHIK